MDRPATWWIDEARPWPIKLAVAQYDARKRSLQHLLLEACDRRRVDAQWRVLMIWQRAGRIRKRNALGDHALGTGCDRNCEYIARADITDTCIANPRFSHLGWIERGRKISKLMDNNSGLRFHNDMAQCCLIEYVDNGWHDTDRAQRRRFIARTRGACYVPTILQEQATQPATDNTAR